MTHRTRRLVGSVCLLPMLFLAACGSSSKGSTVARAADPNPRVMYSVDSDHYMIPESSQMLGDAQGTGLWFWMPSERDVVIAHSDGHDVRTWRTTRANGPSGVSNNPTIAAGQNGVIFLSTDGQLVRLDPASGDITSRPLPLPRDNAVVEGNRPVEIRGVHQANAVAADTLGHVAVALSAASQVIVYDDAAGRFATIDLPGGMEAWSLAYFGDGSLAIGGTDEHASVGRVSIVGPRGSRTYAVPDASRLVALPSGDVLAGAIVPAVLAPDGTTRPLERPEGVQLNARLGIDPLSDGELVVPVRDRMLKLRADGTIVNTYAWPVGRCPMNHLPYDPVGITTTTYVARTCPFPPAGMQVDGAGNVWFFGSYPTTNADQLSVLAGF